MSRSLLHGAVALALVMSGTAISVVTTASLGGVATAATGNGGIGERKAYKFESQRVDDRVEVKVNVATGNLLVKADDLKIAGTGLDLDVTRYYNSLSTDASATSPGWLLGVGQDVRLDISSGSATFHAPSGYQVTFNQNADGSYSAPRDPGIDATLEHRSDGTWKLEWRSKERYIFDASGRWTERRDKNDNTIRFAYASSASTGQAMLLSSITDTRGRTVRFAYTKGLLTTMTDVSGGRTWTYTYDKSNRLATSAVTAYTLVKDNVNVGVTTAYAYDASNRLTTITDPLGHVTKLGYDGTSRKVSSITRVTDTATGTGATTTFSYLGSALDKCSGTDDAVGETKVDGPRTDVADVTTHCYDQHDRVVATFDAKGHKASQKYQSNSNVSQLSESGVQGGPAFGFGWDGNDNMTSVNLPTGGQASVEYNDSANQHLPTGVRDFATASNSTAPTFSYDYDDDGNLIEAKSNALGITYRYCYDAKGNLTRIAPPPLDGLPLDDDTSADACAGSAQGNDTLLSYDTSGQLVNVNPPGANGTVKLTYDPVSRIATRTDGRGVVMRFTYDALDRVTQIYYDASAMSSGPPPAASATKTAQLRSRSGSMSPDSADIPPDNGGGTSAQTWINYSYDTDGNLTSRSDSSGNANFSYDLLNRMVKESPEAPSAVVSYTYDLAGNVTSISATDEPAPVRYAYDKTNLVTSIVDQAGRTTTFDYDDKGNRTATHYPNGVTMASKYDDSRRITCTFSYTGSAPAAGSDGSCPDPSASLLTYVRYHYTGTVNGASADTNRREKADLRDGSTTDYGYDAINRLTDATTKNPAGTVLARYGYDYDDRGDITKQHVTGSSVANRTLTEAYADAGELCWTATGDYTSDCSTPPAGATTYGYNLAGDLTTSSDGLSTTWSMRDHMTSVTPPGSTTPISMTYTDATQDRRVTAGALRMSYNQLGLSNQAPTNASSNATYFVRDPNGLLVGMLTADPATPDDYYVLDGLSSVTATTDESGAVAHRYDYEPFGQEIAPSASDPNPWRFASGYSDTATGMLKFGARYYQPSVARWTQRDPVMGQPGQPLSNNPYAYAGCNPTNNVDPSGRLYEGSDYAANGYQYDWSGVYGACASGMATAGIATLMTGQVELEPVALAGGCVEGMITEMLAQLMPDPADDVFRLFEGIKGVTDLFG